jgi:hypothetical protein
MAAAASAEDFWRLPERGPEVVPDTPPVACSACIRTFLLAYEVRARLTGPKLLRQKAIIPSEL